MPQPADEPAVDLTNSLSEALERCRTVLDHYSERLTPPDANAKAVGDAGPASEADRSAPPG